MNSKTKKILEKRVIENPYLLLDEKEIIKDILYCILKFDDSEI
jgi:hypothetical protein